MLRNHARLFNLRRAAALSAAAACLVGAASAVLAADPGDPDRGRLLYEAQCSACHSDQAHWRDKRVVQSWPQLIEQVRRWQASSGQHWSDEEIDDVAAHLNGLYYRLPCSGRGCEGPRAGRGGRPPGS